MDADKVRLYEAADMAIQQMNRDNVEAFGRLKMAKFDEVHVIQTVTALYRKQAKKAKRRYYEIAYEAYLLAMLLCEIPQKKAHQMADKAVTAEWVQERMEQTDPLTMYRFDAETERKAYRLAEMLEVAPNRNLVIDRALKEWSRQLGQYAINITDYAVLRAYEDAGIEMARWVTQKDERVCTECRGRDGKAYPMDDIPAKPHVGCRCFYVPARE